MPRTTSESQSNYTPHQLMSLILQVELYPEFIPWCQATRIIEQSKDFMIADMVVSFKSFTETYRSEIKVNNNDDGSINIDVHSIEGPFEYLINNWCLIPNLQGSTVQLMVDFSFKSPILNKLISSLLKKATNTMVEAFERRAEHLFGSML